MHEGELNVAAYAVPVFLIAVVVEALLGRRREGYYYFGTAISDLGCGTVFQGVEVIFKLITLGAYAWIYEHFRLVDWAEGHWAPWVIAIVGVDFLFYWWHRASHVVNSLWAVHGVHHQSEDFNLAVALRQPLFEPLTWFLFFVPLAFLGVSPLVYLAAYGLNRFYQFWIHTELVDKLGPLEWILNTPSHHRVHHGVQEQYLDKNYGAILIIWDRIFGTYEREEERVVYGTTTPLASYNPVWANFAIFGRIGRLAGRARALGQKLWAPFAHPAWLPSEGDPDAEADKRMEVPKYRPEISGATMAYVGAHFLFLGVGLFFFVLLEFRWTIPQLCLGAAVAVISGLSFSGLVERRPWALPMELVRLAAMFAAWAWLGSDYFPAEAMRMAAVGGFILSVLGLALFRSRR